MEKIKNFAPLDELSNEELFEVKGGAAGDFVLCIGANSGKKKETTTTDTTASTSDKE
jgi:hypothetical protein